MRQGDTAIHALMRAARRAAKMQSEAHPDTYSYRSVLRSAPSHTGAYLLAALDLEGWELRRKTEAR